MISIKNILITGGAGFIGSNLIFPFLFCLVTEKKQKSSRLLKILLKYLHIKPDDSNRFARGTNHRSHNAALLICKYFLTQNFKRPFKKQANNSNSPILKRAWLPQEIR